MPLSIFLCDDDSVQIDTLSSYINSMRLDDTNIIYTTCGEELLNKISTVKPDIVFLDIKMEGLNGIETGIKLKEQFDDAVIVYITGYSDYALDAFRVRSFDYLIKPVTFSRFETLMRDILVRVSEIKTYKEKHEILVINNKNSNIVIRYDDIICFEKSFRKIIVHTIGAPYEFYGTLTALIEKLNMKTFIQCHQGYIVNISKIKELKPDQIAFYESDLIIPVSRKYKPYIRKAFEKALFS